MSGKTERSLTPGESPKDFQGAPGERVDVAALMHEIRERTKADIAANRDKRPAFKPLTPDFESKMAKKAGDLVYSEELRYLNANYTYSSRLNLDSVTSHRPGIIGKIIVNTKRRLLKFLWDSLLRDYFNAEREYQANLVRFLNDVGQYVGGRDASMFWELVRKIDVDVGKALERIERINDEQMASIRSSERRVFDSLESSARELSARIAALTSSVAQHDDRIRTLDSVARGLEGILGRLGKAASQPHPAETAPLPKIEKDYSYVLLENRYRGSEEEISKRLGMYAQCFQGASLPVLEIGAGRGELQEIFRKASIPSYGVDTDAAMAEASQAKGFDVRLGDGLAHLAALPDKSLGGMIAIQVVEHLTSSQLQQLFTLCREKIVPGGKIIVETINPRSVVALSSNYFRDPTHVWPLHPDTLGHTITLSGLNVVETRFLSPIPDEAKLRPLSVEEYMTPRWMHVIELLNHNVTQLNELLFGPQDYCIVAEAPAGRYSDCRK